MNAVLISQINYIISKKLEKYLIIFYWIDTEYNLRHDHSYSMLVRELTLSATSSASLFALRGSGLGGGISLIRTCFALFNDIETVNSLLS